MRLNQYLSSIGFCSRREADRFITAGRICVGRDGEVGVLGQFVQGNEKIFFDHRLIPKEETPLLLAVNKPKGILCTSAKNEGDNIIDFLDYPKRIYPIGRLDKDSTGLLLMTNQGDLVNKILRAGNLHEKEYRVKINRPLRQEHKKAMEQGLPILGQLTKPCKIIQKSNTVFHIILVQGLNRQIRRMCEYFGYRVSELKRLRIMHVTLGNLEEGEYRNLTKQEERKLKQLLTSSDNRPAKERIN
ncbi:pseudouridine synthase [Clostridia bacterium]|nr:pseudouridine synthase [Clostridia bacterium]